MNDGKAPIKTLAIRDSTFLQPILKLVIILKVTQLPWGSLKGFSAYLMERVPL